MATFKIRTSKPTKNDKFIKFYNPSQYGGVSPCIVGKPMDSEAHCLSNCVGYSDGRFNEVYCEVTGTTAMKYPYLNCNAENLIERAQQLGLKTGTTPKAGALIVWQKGTTLSQSDGAGHVEFVERVIDRNTIFTSASNYGSTTFYNSTRNNNNGSWGIGSPYKFRAFIYLPVEIDNGNNQTDANGCPYAEPTQILGINYKNVSLEGTKWVQWYLCKLGYYTDSTLGHEDGYFGPLTQKGVKEFQQRHNMEADGYVGPLTRAALKNAVKNNDTKPGKTDGTTVINGYTVNISGNLKVGDVVNFTGNKHWTSSNGTAYSECKPGLAKVAYINKSGIHPYSLIRIPGQGSTVYGWVNASNIVGCTGNTTSNAQATVYVPKVGDTVNFTGNKHYAGANSLTGPSCKPGKATITAISEGAKHPYHLKYVNGSSSTVYGWVDKGTFKKA